MGNVYKILAEAKIKNSPDFFSTRLIIELCENIHLHYRNIRWEFSYEEFLQFADTVNNAVVNLKRIKMREKILLVDINPCDGVHGEIPDKEHREGIEVLKPIIQSGKKILPILVIPVEGKPYKYQRLDGYKRYYAFKELDYTEIECFIDKNAKGGGQEGMSWVEKNG